MVGPLKTASSGFTHLLVVVDKFTKWVEANPIRKLNDKTALKFFKVIVVRFDIPHSIITNNGTNLSQGGVEEYCHHNKIRVVVVKQHMPWDGLNGGQTRCWRIRERGAS
jgi:hypothetical protein